MGDLGEGWSTAFTLLSQFMQMTFHEGCDVWVDGGQPKKSPTYPDSPWLDLVESSYYHQLGRRYPKVVTKESLHSPQSSNTSPYAPTASKESIKKFIHDLKLLGRQAAEELINERSRGGSQE
jgi:hypothetical protein